MMLTSQAMFNIVTILEYCSQKLLNWLHTNWHECSFDGPLQILMYCFIDQYGNSLIDYEIDDQDGIYFICTKMKVGGIAWN